MNMNSETGEMAQERQHDSIKQHVYDSSLDYKGRLALRASTGSWKAVFFLMTIGICERMIYFGLATNMITYLTKVMHQDLATAANSVNLWTGMSTVTPILGGFLADAYIGRFYMLLYSAILYVLGLVLFTLSQYIPNLKPCSTAHGSCQHVNKNHKLVFFIAAYIVAVAAGGCKPCSESFGADQFDDNHSEERKQKMSFFNWWSFIIFGGHILGVTLIVYIQDDVSWGIAFSSTTSTMAMMVVVLVLGKPFCRYRISKGSPVTSLLQVLVAVLAKRHLPYPLDPTFLYEIPETENLQGQVLCHTNRLRFLDKAAIIEERESGATTQSQWRLKTVTQVEELKLVLSTTPVWLTSLVFGIGWSITTTFFVKQGSMMNRKVSKHLEIPPASIVAIASLALMVCVVIYDKFLIPYLRRATGTERGINLLKRIGFGMILLILGMVVSALVEGKRITTSRNGETIQVWWLVPQLLIMGLGDGLSFVGLQEFYYEQVPESMRSLGMAFFFSVVGVGSFISSLLIIIVNNVTGKNGGKKWIGKNVNDSRLDYYYWLLAIICALNLCVFVLMARNYRYKKVQRRRCIDDSKEGKKSVEMNT